MVENHMKSPKWNKNNDAGCFLSIYFKNHCWYKCSLREHIDLTKDLFYGTVVLPTTQPACIHHYTFVYYTCMFCICTYFLQLWIQSWITGFACTKHPHDRPCAFCPLFFFQFRQNLCCRSQLPAAWVHGILFKVATIIVADVFCLQIHIIILHVDVVACTQHNKSYAKGVS